jgi:hypothetical protein
MPLRPFWVQTGVVSVVVFMAAPFDAEWMSGGDHNHRGGTIATN